MILPNRSRRRGSHRALRVVAEHFGIDPDEARMTPYPALVHAVQQGPMLQLVHAVDNVHDLPVRSGGGDFGGTAA